jgi:hypothetical protein
LQAGTYYHSLSTSECLDAESSEAYAAWPDATPDATWPRLERRAWLHERVPDPVADGRHRSAAIGVSTLTVVRVRNRSFDGYKMFLSPRSVTVATQRRRYHVVPSGMFQPFIPGESADLLQEQFSVAATAVREFRWYERESGELRICDEFLQQCEQAELLPDQRWVQLVSLTRPGLEVEPMWWDRLRASTIVAPGAAAVELGLQVARAVVS